VHVGLTVLLLVCGTIVASTIASVAAIGASQWYLWTQRQSQIFDTERRIFFAIKQSRAERWDIFEKRHRARFEEQYRARDAQEELAA